MHRVVAICLALLAAGLVLAGGLTTRWWSYGDEDTSSSIGLRRLELCTEAGCRQSSIAKLAPGPQWVRAGTAAYSAALLAGGLLLLVAGRVAAGKPGALLDKTCLVAQAGAAAAGLVFVITAPEYPTMSAAYSMAAYFAGAIAGTAACVAALRLSIARA